MSRPAAVAASWSVHEAVERLSRSFDAQVAPGDPAAVEALVKVRTGLGPEDVEDIAVVAVFRGGRGDLHVVYRNDLDAARTVEILDEVWQSLYRRAGH